MESRLLADAYSSQTVPALEVIAAHLDEAMQDLQHKDQQVSYCSFTPCWQCAIYQTALLQRHRLTFGLVCFCS